MNSAPCKNCNERKIYCHSYCNKYKKYEELRQEIKKKKNEEVMLNGHVLIARKNFTGRKIKEL